MLSFQQFSQVVVPPVNGPPVASVGLVVRRSSPMSATGVAAEPIIRRVVYADVLLSA